MKKSCTSQAFKVPNKKNLWIKYEINERLLEMNEKMQRNNWGDCNKRKILTKNSDMGCKFSCKDFHFTLNKLFDQKRNSIKQ